MSGKAEEKFKLLAPEHFFWMIPAQVVWAISSVCHNGTLLRNGT